MIRRVKFSDTKERIFFLNVEKGLLALLPLDSLMVLFVLQEIMIATVFLNLAIRVLVPKEREPANEDEGCVSRSLGNVRDPKPNTEINLNRSP